MRILIILLGIITCCQISFGQRIKRLKTAGKLYEDKKYIDAAKEYEALLSSKTSAAIMGVDAKANLADCYRVVGKTEEAEELFREVINEVVGRPDTRLQYAEVLMLNGKLDEAKDELLLYSDDRPDDPRASALSARCDLIAAIEPIYSNIDIQLQNNANRRVNDEFGLALCGTSLVFSSDRVIKGSSAEFTGQERSYINLYISKMGEEGQLEKPKRFPKRINGPNRHDGPATFSRDGKMMIYSQSVREDIDDEQLFLQLVSTTYENDEWSKPQALSFVEAGYLYSHPCLSPTGNELYFMSNQSGGYGGTDIWMSRKNEDGTWGKPTNLGKDINTKQDEGFPYLHPSGTLYFASKGHANYGGYDLFLTKPLGNGVDWLPAQNLGVPMNSTKDDTYFLLMDNGLSGYISSARDGDDNIYHFVPSNVDIIPLPVGIEERTAPDFLGLEEVIEVENKPNITSNEWNATKIDTSETDADFVDRMIREMNDNNGTNNNTLKDPELVTENTDPNDPNNPTGNLDSTDPDNTFTENPDDPTDPDSTDPDNNSIVVDDTDFTEPTIGNNPNINTREPEDNPSLSVEVYIIDAEIETSLDNAVVKVLNKITQEEEEYPVKSGGVVILSLLPDQVYEVQATCANYYGGRLPITTYGAYYTESLSAKLPLIKKEN
ncbi:MAG: tetratricopeptide repeat protein [Saprospiraceae bacterium]|nr:tetratricopeptide repeat protein [Saprospiraceae bacterium]